MPPRSSVHRSGLGCDAALALLPRLPGELDEFIVGLVVRALESLVALASAVSASELWAHGLEVAVLLAVEAHAHSRCCAGT